MFVHSISPTPSPAGISPDQSPIVPSGGSDSVCQPLSSPTSPVPTIVPSNSSVIQWRIRGGGPGCLITSLSVHTSLIIHYSTTRCMTLLKTIAGATSSRYALEVDRTSEQSASLRSIRTGIKGEPQIACFPSFKRA